MATTEQATAFALHLQKTKLNAFFESIGRFIADPFNPGERGMVIDEVDRELQETVHSDTISATMRRAFVLASNKRLERAAAAVVEATTSIEYEEPDMKQRVDTTFDVVSQMQDMAKKQSPDGIDAGALYTALLYAFTNYPSVLDPENGHTIGEVNEAIALLGLPSLPEYTGDPEKDDQLYQAALLAVPDEDLVVTSPGGPYAAWFNDQSPTDRKLVM